MGQGGTFEGMRAPTNEAERAHFDKARGGNTGLGGMFAGLASMINFKAGPDQARTKPSDRKISGADAPRPTGGATASSSKVRPKNLLTDGPTTGGGSLL